MTICLSLKPEFQTRKTAKIIFEKSMKEDGLDETDFASVSHEVLAKIKGEKLKMFILTINQDVTKSKILKKGKLNDAIKVEKNLISLDFKCRKMKCIAY